MIDVTAVDEISGDVRARSNVVRLAAAQALTGANSAVIFATGSIVGATLAPSISLATVPLSMYVVALTAMAVLVGVDAPKPAPSDLHGGRPLVDIVRQPRFIAAAFCGIVSYPMMNLVMTSAPLAMKMCGLSVSDSNFGIQWHIVAMYGPSFFTGSLIARFGAPRIVALGLSLEAAGAMIGLSGITAMHFWATLIVLGVGKCIAVIPDSPIIAPAAS